MLSMAQLTWTNVCHNLPSVPRDQVGVDGQRYLLFVHHSEKGQANLKKAYLVFHYYYPQLAV